MDKQQLIDCFEDTLKMSESSTLAKATEEAKKSTKVYEENFESGATKYGYQARLSENGFITVQEGTCFATAKKYVGQGKIGVLNFANPHNPGGGVVNGAMAQEECLCRSSNLYPCLLVPEAINEYYNYNKKITNNFFSDRVVYTDNVTVFKTDDTVPVLMPKSEWFNVSVFTCAAPYLSEGTNVDSVVLKNIFIKRIRNIFEVALDNHIQILILGAFGCGAFKNPPEIVASAFNDVIKELYPVLQHNMKNIVFAIKSTNNDLSKDCPNITAFKSEFNDTLSGFCMEQEKSEAKNHRKSYDEYICVMEYCDKKDSDYKYGPSDPNATRILYDERIKLFSASMGKTLEFNKNYVTVGKEADCDIKFDSNYISRHHARFYFENSVWFVADTGSLNGVWLNGKKLEPKTKYELFANDEIDIAHEETLVFYKTKSQESDLTKEQQIENLERAICDFYKTEDKETRKYLFAIIASLLLKCPMYIPVAVDTEAMLKAIDIEHLEIGKELNLQNDVRMEILTIGVNGEEHVPIFTTKDEVDKGPDTSILNMYPCDYLPKIAAMDKDIIINAFGDNNFVISKTLLNSIILPMLNDTGSNNDSENSTDFEVREGVVIDGKYELLKLIGQSAFSKIYLAMDKRLNKAWAVKICDKKDALKSTIDAMVNEANMVKHLDHPAIPTIVDIIDTDRYLCIVEDYIEGATLENVLKEYGAQPQENVIEWAKQLCDVLGYLHSQNPPHIYRDVKPANIILKPNGKIVLVDFGIMRTYKPNNLADTVALGTKGYAAPEQYGNRQTDARTDIYGLGMTLHHLLTGVDPKTNNGQTLPICQINPNLSKGLEYIINKCIELDPDKRFQSMWELKSALDNSTNCVYASPDVLEKKPKTSLKDLFKRNKSKAVNKTVADIYNKSNPKMREMIYYGDKHSAEKILLDICHFAFNSESEEDIILSNQIYVDTWVRIKGSIAGIEQQLPSVVKERVLAKYPNYNQLVIGKSIDKSIEIILANEPTLAQQLAQYEMIKQTVNENAEKNKGIENLHIGDSDYGLVPGKPVFVNGFGEDKLYLENLYTSSGVKTTYNRTGSMSIVGIAGPVDEYQIFANGSFCCNIYLCNYGSFSSTTAPRGFTYGSYPYNKTDDDNVVTIYASPDIMGGKYFDECDEDKDRDARYF